MTLEQIYVLETYIYCLPAFNKSEYAALTVFEEAKNIALNCDCLLTWREVDTFATECDFGAYETTFTPYTQFTEEEGGLSTEEENGCCPSGSGGKTRGTPPTPGDPPTHGKHPSPFHWRPWAPAHGHHAHTLYINRAVHSWNDDIFPRQVWLQKIQVT